jgi:nucleoside-triphosphatase THEP1
MNDINKVLMFDTEHGSHTLGGEQEINKLFNCPVLKPAQFNDFRNIITSMYTTKRIEVEKKISDDLSVKEVQEQTVLKDGVNVDALVIDSFSELAKKFQRSLLDSSGTMKLNSWGKLKNTLDTLLEFITKVPGILIVTCHSKTETLEDGRTKIKPYIDGSTKEDISKWFDFVLYTYTKKNGKSEDYMWRTKHSEIYEHAKDRTDLLDADMKQDFQPVIKAARDKGFSNVRILIVGSPGTGKTKSLSTLINERKKDGDKNNNS